MSWVDDDGNRAWPDQWVTDAEVEASRAEADQWGRLHGWLKRIGDGIITIPFPDMDKTKAVPIAAWLATHMHEAAREWPDEAEQRRRTELRRAEGRVAEAQAELERLKRGGR